MLELKRLAFSTGAAMLVFLPAARGQEPSAQDKAFVADAGSGGMLEVRLGQFAAQTASSDEVKKFGEQMVGDHSKANEELHGLAAQQPLEIPKVLNARDQHVLDHLEALRGADFDKAYVAQMVEDHKTDVAAFEKEASEGSDVQIKGFAEKTLSTLKHHLEMAEKLAGE